MIDEKGQIAVDFLLGISLFLIALMFTVQFIPGMFMSGSSGESSLDYTAYRTSTILAEDAGWWANDTASGTNWEYHPEKALRIGLAMDDETRSRLTKYPNILSSKKIEQFMAMNDSDLAEMLGIYNNVDGTLFYYGYNISLKQISPSSQGKMFILNDTDISRGQLAPTDRDVSKLTRLVLVEKGSMVFVNASSFLSSDNTFRVKGPVKENITIRFSELNDTSFVNATLNSNILTSPSDYIIYEKKGWEKYPWTGNISSEDLIYIDFNHKLFTNETDYMLHIEFDNIIGTGDSIGYKNLSKPSYQPAFLSVEVW